MSRQFNHPTTKGMTIMMHRSRPGRLGAIAFAGGGMVSLALIVTSAVSGSPASAEDVVGTLDSSTAAVISPRFADAQSEADDLPGFLRDGEQALDSIDPASSRLLGTDNETRIWIAMNRSRAVCLVTLLPGPDQFASQTCASPEDFAKQGLALQTGDSERATRAYFIPRGYTTTNSSLRSVGQLLLGDPEQTDGAPPTVVRSSDRAASPNASITLPRFSSIVESAG